jgi:hypothetical protein
MERAVYCYGWLPGRPNCHPVHTMKNIGMVEDLVKSHATMLSWSMMGSGAISLPFLERQIYGEVPPQLRFHGYLNDAEFNKECLKHGILPFAVVYQAQGWEFPVVLNQTETEILEMNYIRSEEQPKWYGLREFTNGKYHALFNKTFADYFPQGIYNSDGAKVEDLWEECTTRDMYGNPTHSHWVEVEGMPQTCYGMCRNNPVWREYLKKIIEIQIDAGAMAIQLDESETPICSTGFGGCFCKDCMKQFRSYLQRRKAAGDLPQDMKEIDLERFDYGVYLRERHVAWPNDFMNIPFSKVYWDFIVETHNKHFQEIILHVKEYGRSSKGIDVKVSGNFTNMHLLYLPSLKDVDYCITELRRTVFRRHNWFRLAAGYTQDKPLIFAESPYDGFMPKFVELIHHGKADDYYRLFIMEAAVHGCNMAFPYGAWMGNQTRESFFAPYRTGYQVQDFLYRHSGLFSKKSGANVLVLYGYGAYMERDWQCGQGENLAYDNKNDLLSYSVSYDERAARMPFFEITQKMVDSRIPFDVLILGDNSMVPDTLSRDDLSEYDLVVIPDCNEMTERQVKLIEEYAASHPVYVYGRYAENCSGAAQRLSKSNNSVVIQDISDPETSSADFMASLYGTYEEHRLIDYDNANIYMQQALTEKGPVIHLLNYVFDTEKYRTVPQTVLLDIRDEKCSHISTYTLDEKPVRYEIIPSIKKGIIRLKLYDIPCYCAVLFEV